MSKTDIRNFIITFIVGIVIWFAPCPEGLKPQAQHMAAIFIATIVGFIFHPIPIGALALMSVGISGFLGVCKPAEALSGFGNATIWLIVSAFVFAKGFSKTGLGARLAYTIMKNIGGNTLSLAYTIAISDLIIAPATPSNTARGGGILYPIVQSLCTAFGSEPGPTAKKMGSYLVTSCFHVNCITSSMFITSVAPNAVVVALAAQTIGVNLTWGTWATACVLPGLIALVLTPLLVYKLNPPELKDTPEAKDYARAELEKMGPMSTAEKVVAFVFVLALVLWATSSFTKLNATMIALICVSLMLVGHAVEWKDVLTTTGAWDTLVWMGGLMSLATALNKSGFTKWIAGQAGAAMKGFDGVTALILLCIVYMYAHYAFASMAAHVAAMYGAFATVAVSLGAPAGLTAMALGCITGIMGSLTHYSTGAAPIYFGGGYTAQGEWWKIGFFVSVLSMICFIGLGSFWWKIIGLY